MFIASGDLSHRLAPDGQYGFNECGPEFDGRLMEYLKGPDREAIMDLTRISCRGRRMRTAVLIMMFGALDEFEIKSEVYSYEGPLCGLCVAEFTPVSKIQEETLLDRLDRRDIEISTIRNAEDPYTALARKSLEMYVLNGTMIDVPEVLPEEMRWEGGALSDQEAWKAEGLHWDHNADTKTSLQRLYITPSCRHPRSEVRPCDGR